MEISYWTSRWRKGKTGWHMDHVFPPLPKFWPQLSLSKDATILVPLCGKSQDLQWFSDQGYYVIGIEASGKAIEQFVTASQQPFSRTSSHGYPIFRSSSIELWRGNFLALPKGATKAIDAIYDKASLVALPPDKRGKYIDIILNFCDNHTQIFLQTFEYEQEEMSGPPFSVPYSEIKSHFGHSFNIQLLQEQSRIEDVQKFKHRGLSSYFIEKVYHLYPK